MLFYFVFTLGVSKNGVPVVEFLLPFFERALEGVASLVQQTPNQPLYLADFGVSVGTKDCSGFGSY